MPLRPQRGEIDHSPLKVVAGTDAGPIGQPWLPLLIDYYSRMVTGFCLGFEPPSYGVIMEALRHAVLPDWVNKHCGRNHKPCSNTSQGQKLLSGNR